MVQLVEYLFQDLLYQHERIYCMADDEGICADEGERVWVETCDLVTWWKSVQRTDSVSDIQTLEEYNVHRSELTQSLQ